MTSADFALLPQLLYRQRFFTYLLPKLVGLYKGSTAEGDAKNIYLVALSTLLRHIPKQLTLTELPKVRPLLRVPETSHTLTFGELQLLPLLITSLDLPDTALRANVIEALTVLVNDVPAELEISVGSIATKVLRGLSAQIDGIDDPSAVVSRLRVWWIAQVDGRADPSRFSRNSGSLPSRSLLPCRRTFPTSPFTHRKPTSSRSWGGLSTTRGETCEEPRSNVGVSGSCTPVNRSCVRVYRICCASRPECDLAELGALLLERAVLDSSANSLCTIRQLHAPLRIGGVMRGEPAG